MDKSHFVNDVTCGCAFALCRDLELSDPHVSRSKRFVGQVHRDAFGSINLNMEVQLLGELEPGQSLIQVEA